MTNPDEELTEVTVADMNPDAPEHEADEEYGRIDDDPPGVDAPPDLEDQNDGEGS
jgi:hypothetical protein